MALNKEKLASSLIDALSPDNEDFLKDIPEEDQEEAKKIAEDAVKKLANDLAGAIHSYILEAEFKVESESVSANVKGEDELVLVEPVPPPPPGRLPGLSVNYPLPGSVAAKLFLRFLPRFRTKVTSNKVEVIKKIVGIK